MNFEDNKILDGKIFISTRPAGKSEELRECLQLYGATLVEMPMIDIRLAQLSDEEKDIIKDSGQFDWIIFTSSNGISCFFDHLKEISGSYALADHLKIAVIGNKTAEELKKYGHHAHYVNKGTTGNDFSEELEKILKYGSKVLIPAGNLARETIENKLNNLVKLTRINVYHTIMPENGRNKELQRIIDDQYEMIIFTSPSGFHNFRTLVEEKMDLKSLRAACIGSTTAEALNEEGISPQLVSKTMNSEGIVGAILDFYKIKKT